MSAKYVLDFDLAEVKPVAAEPELNIPEYDSSGVTQSVAAETTDMPVAQKVDESKAQFEAGYEQAKLELSESFERCKQDFLTQQQDLKQQQESLAANEQVLSEQSKAVAELIEQYHNQLELLEIKAVDYVKGMLKMAFARLIEQHIVTPEAIATLVKQLFEEYSDKTTPHLQVSQQLWKLLDASQLVEQGQNISHSQHLNGLQFEFKQIEQNYSVDLRAFLTELIAKLD